MTMHPALIAAQIKPAFSQTKAAAIYKLNHQFGLSYKHICKLIQVSEPTFYRIVKRKGAYK